MPGEIENLDIKIKLLIEFVNNGGVAELAKLGLVDNLYEIKKGRDGKVMPETVSRGIALIMNMLLASELMPPVFSPDFISYYSSTLQKEKCFDQINIDTEMQFDAVYDEFKKKSDIIFRGQGEASWRLYNTMQRKWIVEGLEKTEESYETFLEKLVNNGKNEYHEQIQSILEANHIDTINTISVLSYLQHHKCPTPLLDWTYSFQNALFFALEGITIKSPKREIDEYLSVYYLEEEHFDDANVSKIIDEAFNAESEELKLEMIDKIAAGDEEKKQHMIKHFKGRGLLDKSKIQGSGLIEHSVKIDQLFKHPLPLLYFSDTNVDTNFIFSVSNSQNIKNQNGVFMWNSNPSKPVEMVSDEFFGLTEDGKPHSNYNFCKCFNIKKDLADYVHSKLEADGITRELIYPTADVDASAIYEQSKE